MDKYLVKLYSCAYRDLDEIYSYIANTLLEPETAAKIIDGLENTIFSLESFPERGAILRKGVYAGQGYRQLFYKHYTIIYYVLREKKEVYVVKVRYRGNTETLSYDDTKNSQE